MSAAAPTTHRRSPSARLTSVKKKQEKTLAKRKTSMTCAASSPVATLNAAGSEAVAKHTRSLTNARRLSMKRCAQRDS